MSKGKIKFYSNPEFFGTEQYHRGSFMPRLLHTDGVDYLVKTHGGYWLLDMVASYLHKVKDFSVVTFVKDGDGGVFRISTDMDGDKFIDVVAEQKVDFTDMPCNVKLYLSMADETRCVLMLPSEY